MERKLRAFTEEESLAYIAFEQYMARWQNFMAKKEAKEKGIEEGEARGKIVGAKMILSQLLEKKYPGESLSFLNDYSLDQIHRMMDHIFEPLSLEELKKLAQNE